MNQFKGKLYKNDSADPVLVDAMVDGANILLESDHGKDYLPIAEISIKEGGDLGDRVRVTHAASRSVVIFNGHSFLEELETRHPELDHIKASRAIKHKVKHSNLIRGSHVAIIIGVVVAAAAPRAVRKRGHSGRHFVQHVVHVAGSCEAYACKAAIVDAYDALLAVHEEWVLTRDLPHGLHLLRLL